MHFIREESSSWHAWWRHSWLVASNSGIPSAEVCIVPGASDVTVHYTTQPGRTATNERSWCPSFVGGRSHMLSRLLELLCLLLYVHGTVITFLSALINHWLQWLNVQIDFGRRSARKCNHAARSFDHSVISQNYSAWHRTAMKPPGDCAFILLHASCNGNQTQRAADVCRNYY